LGISDGDIPVMVRRYSSSDKRTNWFASLNTRDEHVFGITGTNYQWATRPRTNRAICWRKPLGCVGCWWNWAYLTTKLGSEGWILQFGALRCNQVTFDDFWICLGGEHIYIHIYIHTHVIYIYIYVLCISPQKEKKRSCWLKHCHY